MLAAATPRGFFRKCWVLVRFVPSPQANPVVCPCDDRPVVMEPIPSYEDLVWLFEADPVDRYADDEHEADGFGCDPSARPPNSSI